MDDRERARRQREFRKGLPPKGICIDCGKVRRLVADHRTPVTLGGSWDPAKNRDGRCAKCHGIKTQREKVSPFEFLE